MSDLPEPIPEDDQEKELAALAAFGAHLVALGWASEAGYSQTGVALQLTEQGQQRLGQVIACCRDLHLAHLDQNEVWGFLLFVRNAL